MSFWNRTPRTTKVTVDVPSFWFSAAKRPAVFWPVAALTGAVPTFVPGYLYTLGKEGVPWHDWRVICGCILVYSLAIFYGRLGGAVMRRAWELRKQTGTSEPA